MCLLIRFFHNLITRWGARIDTIFRTFTFGAPGLIVKEFADRTAPERAGGKEQCPASRRNADEPGGCREKEKTRDASGRRLGSMTETSRVGARSEGERAIAAGQISEFLLLQDGRFAGLTCGRCYGGRGRTGEMPSPGLIISALGRSSLRPAWDILFLPHF